MIDAAIYMVVVGIVGVKASLLYVVPALIGAAVIVLGAWIAAAHERASPASPAL